MDSHRELAIAAMQAATATAANDFMHQANIPMPVAIAPGALPAMIRETVYAEDLHRLVDVDMLWTIGDYVPELDCSAYYDPSSPWYNVIYGAYGLRSYKRDGAAWGFDRSGRPELRRVLQSVGRRLQLSHRRPVRLPGVADVFRGRRGYRGDGGRMGRRGHGGDHSVGAARFHRHAGESADVCYLRRPAPRSLLTQDHPAYETVKMRGSGVHAPDDERPAADYARLGRPLSRYRPAPRYRRDHRRDGEAVPRALTRAARSTTA